MPKKLFRRQEIELRGFRTKSENEIQGFHKDDNFDTIFLRYATHVVIRR